MLARDQTTSFDCEYNGGLNAIDTERIHLQSSVSRAMPTIQQMDQQQQPTNHQHGKQIATIDTAHGASKKSVILNLKSGTINSTVEEFGSLSTRFDDTFTRSSSRCRWWILILIFVGGVCCVVIGAAVTHLFGTRSCDANRNQGKNCLTEDCIRTASTLLSAMNRSVDPCENFFQYACGAWNKKNVIPEDKSSFSTFEVLADQQQIILRQLLEEPSNIEDNNATIKAKQFYKSCMNISKIREIGSAPLLELLNRYGGWPVLDANWRKPQNQTIEELMGTMRRDLNEHFMISLIVGPDDMNSSVNVLLLDQLMLALPSREYYLKNSSRVDRMGYYNYMTKIALLLGADPQTVHENMNEVLDFEIKLANVSIAEIERHDAGAAYKKLTMYNLIRIVPQFKWDVYLQAVFGPTTTINADEPLVIYAMSYFIQLGRILSETEERVVRNYLLWRTLLSLTSHLVDDFQKERIEFQRILLGIKSERHRWAQCTDWTNKKLGMAVGALFIRDNFNSESKDTALEMIHSIREAFNELLDENDWMDAETRDVAKEKANSINERIGYPEILTNTIELEIEYSNLTIVEDLFLENVLHILKWDSERLCQLLRKPVEKHKWSTEPAVVNAFYNPNRNDIVFPAGILQPLFYSKNFPKSLNYGGIGVVIGHEITHGFDDKGRQYDKNGNLKQWWNNATIMAFRDRAQCIIDQYSRYKVNEVGMYMNGKLTQSENIADNGGLKQAFRAYKKWAIQHGADDDLPGLDLNHDQLFFLNYAQIWCGSMRPEDALSKLRSSVHSPGVIRVLGPLSNSKEFSEAYHCPSGSPMNPTNKCSVW